MFTEMNSLILGPLAFVKEIAIGMVPENFKRAINYGWTGLMGLGNWGAYLMAATYWASAEVGIGADICEFFGYGYWVID
jgi:hypothetical protein